MKTLVFISLLIAVVTFNSYSQDKFITKTGHVWFHSKTDFKEIEAHNRQATSILDVKTGEVVVSVFIRDFKFDNQLVEEHFNENYIESHKYPKAKFKGKITNIASVDLTKDGTYTCNVEGEMDMHGKIKQIKEKGTAVVKGGKIKATANFKITADEFAIAIPEIVKDKIAKFIDVYIEFEYTPFTK